MPFFDACRFPLTSLSKCGPIGQHFRSLGSALRFGEVLRSEQTEELYDERSESTSKGYKEVQNGLFDGISRTVWYGDPGAATVKAPGARIF